MLWKKVPCICKVDLEVEGVTLMGLLDWFNRRRKRKPEEASPVEEKAHDIEERVEKKSKRAKRKRKRESV